MTLSNPSRRSRARLVEENEPTKRRHRLDPPLQRRQLWKDLTICEPVLHEHDVARTFRRGPIGDTQVAVERIARLGEHGGSVSRGARRVSVSRNRCLGAWASRLDSADVRGGSPSGVRFCGGVRSSGGCSFGGGDVFVHRCGGFDPSVGG
jgi:hypothetical protein